MFYRIPFRNYLLGAGNLGIWGDVADCLILTDEIGLQSWKQVQAVF